MRVMVVDGAVTCPSCKCNFAIVQNKSVGAQYAKDWMVLGKKHRDFLTWWVSNPNRRNELFEKSELLAGFKNETGIGMSEDGFNARISELLSAGTKYGVPLLFRTKNEKVRDPHTFVPKTVKPPVYGLHLKRVMDVLYAGGRLV